MGFFSSLASGAIGALGGFLAGGPAGAVAGGIGGLALAPDTETQIVQKGATTRQFGESASQQVVRLANEQAAQTQLAVIQAGGAPAMIAAAGLKNRIMTVVQTISPAGVVIRSKTLEGAPFLMRKDFVTLKRTQKLIRVAARRLGSRGSSKKDLDHAEQDGLIKGLLAAGDKTSTALALLDD